MSAAQTLFDAFAPILVFWAIMALLLWRNRWVYRQRIRLNNAWHAWRMSQLRAGVLDGINDPWYDHYYHSYSAMLLRFWIWDISKLRRRDRVCPYSLDRLEASA